MWRILYPEKMEVKEKCRECGGATGAVGQAEREEIKKRAQGETASVDALEPGLLLRNCFFLRQRRAKFVSCHDYQPATRLRRKRTA